MTIFKLAVRNLLGAGMKTWLNAVVLSLAFVTIIWAQGLYKGMDNQASRAMIGAEYGGGQYWVESYDPYDPLSLQEAHRKLTGTLEDLVESKQGNADSDHPGHDLSGGPDHAHRP